MSKLRVNLPSEQAMKGLCHKSADSMFLVQALSLFVPIALTFLVLCTAVSVPGNLLAFIFGNGLGTYESWLEWLQSTVIFSLAAAGTIVSLTIMAKVYLQSQFGRPTHVCELQADLDRDSVLQICVEYLKEHCLYDCLLEDMGRGRLVALVHESRHSMTFLDISTVCMDQGSTWIVVRTASVVCGRAALLSSFYNDFGVSRGEANKMIRMFSPYASRKRRRVAGAQSSQQAIPALKPVGACPPPLLSRNRTLPRRREVRAVYR
jgi:hypothetical protein